MRRILSLILAMLLFSSCGYFPSSNTRDLLLAPRLNSRQVALDAALRETLNLTQIVYKYPQTGDFRSPFVFEDLTGNGREDAIIFYAHADTPGNVRFKVMAERDDGSWYAVNDMSGAGEGDQINFVQFASLMDNGQKNMIVGWQNASLAQSHLGVYSYTESGFKKEILHPYIMWDIGNYGGKLEKIAIISQHLNEIGFGGYYQISLLGRGVGGSIAVLDSEPLPSETAGVLQILRVLLPAAEADGAAYTLQPAIFIDILMNAGGVQPLIATAVARIEDNNNLTIVVGENDNMLFRETMREYNSINPALSIDIKRSGIGASIPVQMKFSEEFSEEFSGIALTELLWLQNDSEFIVENTTAVNYDDGYLMILPEEWVDKVMVISVPEYREWQFFTVNDEGQQGVELLRIQTMLSQDYRDIFAEYTLIEQQGQIQYYVYIPDQDENETLAIDLDEVRMLFRTI